MANKRALNIVNQQRLDTPDLRSIESAVRNDFDELFSSLVLGENKSYVVRGMEIQVTGSTIGSSANSLQLEVADSSILHGKSNTAGTFLTIPTGTVNETLNPTINTKITGSFTPNALNYIGIELNREVDSTSTGPKYLWNQASQSEFIKTLPLAEILDFKIHITSSIFASNVLPIAAITTDGSNNVVDIEDRRDLLFRLATSGASTPNPSYSYPWTDGRLENPNKSTSSTSPFKGGDKQISSLRSYVSAICTSIKEINGTAFWYSNPTGGSIVNLRNDLANTYISGSGNFVHSETIAGRINWTSDLYLNLISSRVSYKILSNAATSDVTIGDGQVAYIELVRGVVITPNLIFTNGSTTVTSVGAVAWTSGLQAGDYIKVASQSDSFYYEILLVDSTSQVTLKTSFNESDTGIAGIQAKYAWGVYQTAATPSTQRHIKIANKENVTFNDSMYWLFSRSDNASPDALVYVRNGNQLQLGEIVQVVDNATQQMIQYIGAQSSVQDTPDYAGKGVTAGSLALPNYNSLVTDDLTRRVAQLTGMLGDSKQDFNIEIDPGVVTWDGSNISITGMKLSIPGTTVGSAPVSINTYASAALAVDTALYVDINRSSGTTLTLASATLVTLTPSQQRLVLIRRIGADIWVR